MAFTTAWQESKPDNDSYGYEIDDYMLGIRTDVRERLAVQHQIYLSETGKTDVGEHTPGECTVVFCGDKADFPTPSTANSGCIAIAEDEDEQVYYWSGSAWTTTYRPSVALFVPTGMVVPFAGSSAPTDWLLCNGAAISRTTYSDLFGICSTTYGVGNGTTTFNIPDLRGYFVRGKDTSGTVDPDVRDLGSTQTDAFQGHKHSVTQNAQKHDEEGAEAGESSLSDYSSASISIGSPTTDGVNGTPRTESETRPVNMALNYIIKT